MGSKLKYRKTNIICFLLPIQELKKIPDSFKAIDQPDHVISVIAITVCKVIQNLINKTDFWSRDRSLKESIIFHTYTVCPKNNRTLYLNHTTGSAIY